MNYFFMITIFLSSFSVSAHVRNIFMYDSDWDYVDYEIVASGWLDSDRNFKILRSDNECKIVVQNKKPFNSIKS